MGQCHKLFCPEARTLLKGHMIDTGPNADEHVWSDYGPAALALLMATGLGDHPRDLPWASAGLWAGLTPLFIGDEAQSGDLVGREDILADEPSLYQRLHDLPVTGLAELPEGQCLCQMDQVLLPVLERVMSIRVAELDRDGHRTDIRGFTTLIPVVRDNGSEHGWTIDAGPDEESFFSGNTPAARRMDGWRRMRVFNEPMLWKRRPLDMAWCGPGVETLPEAPDEVPWVSEVGEGSPLLWANLDRHEVVDPRALLDTPDLAGIMKGRSARAVMLMLFYHQARSLSDFGGFPEGPPIGLLGRWRGDRIALLGPRGIVIAGQGRIDHREIRRSFIDISGQALLFLDHKDKAIFTENSAVRKTLHDTSLSLSAEETIILRAALAGGHDPRRFSRDGSGALTGLRAILTGPARLERDAMGHPYPDGPLRLAATFDLYTQGEFEASEGVGAGKIWLDGQAGRAIAHALRSLPEVAAHLYADDENLVDYHGPIARVIDLDRLSAHDKLAILRPLPPR